MSRYKLIAIDLDGTLLHKDKSISAYSFEVLRKAKEQGLIIVPCTGRGALGVPEELTNSGLYEYLIDNNGSSVLKVDGTILNEELIATGRAMELYNFLMTRDVFFDFNINEICYKDRRFSYLHDTFLTSLFGQNKNFRNFIVTDSLYYEVWRYNYRLQKCFVIMKHSSQWIGNRLLNEAKAAFPDLSFTVSMRNGFEINAPRGNKGYSLKWLCNHLGIDLTETIVFGDNDNDISSLDAGGLSIAPANAVTNAKQHADYITLSNDEDGVAKAIEKFVL